MLKRMLMSTFLLLMVLSCGEALCQEAEKTEWSGVVSVNPLGLFVGAANVSYEHVVSPSTAFLVSGVFGKISSGSWDWTTYGAGVAVKKYVRKNAPKGFHVGAGSSVLFIDSEISDYYLGDASDSSVFVSLSGIGGYQWIVGGDFAIDLAFGLSYYIGELELLGSELPLQGIGPYLGFSLGYAF